MRNTLLASAVALGLLAGCGQGADDDATGNTAANDAPVLPVTDANAAAASATMTAIPTEPVAPDRAAVLMHDRHENYERIGDAMKVITRELKGASPNLAAVREGAGTIATLAPQIPSWFPPGTGPDVGKTEAKAEIWQRPEDFAAKAHSMNQAAIAFQAAAGGSDLAAIRAAHANLGKSCKACHDLYREEE